MLEGEFIVSQGTFGFCTGGMLLLLMVAFGQCSRKKLFCDGLSPCGSCSGRGKRHACLRDGDRDGNDRRGCGEFLPSLLRWWDIAWRYRMHFPLIRRQ